MADQWYYGSDTERRGPYSSSELKELAAAGRISPTHTVWKEGVEQGVPAARVKNLFAASAASSSGATQAPAGMVSPSSPIPPSPETPASDESEGPVENEVEQANPEPAPAQILTSDSPAAGISLSGVLPSPGDKPVEEAGRPQEKQPAKQAGYLPTKKLRAIAIKGAIIANCDGTTVYFRKKCDTCGAEETGRSKLPIRVGMIRTTYFCRKCRRARTVEIQGMG